MPVRVETACSPDATDEPACPITPTAHWGSVLAWVVTLWRRTLGAGRAWASPGAGT